MPPPTRRDPQIEPAVFDRVVAGVQEGRYHLLLGAGASNGVTNPSGRLLMAADLERRLITELEVQPVGPIGLPRAYEATVDALGTEGALSLLRHLYSGCEPLEWHRKLPLVPWEAIWSFNIDDVIEESYDRQTARVQRALPMTWRERPRPYGGSTDEVAIIHLHGFVGRTGPGHADLVFSRSDYHQAVHASSQTNWQTTFRGDYSAQPFIIVGARLHDEWDLIEVLQGGNDSSTFGTPSLVVLPEMDDFTRREYIRWGLTPVEATAEEFLEHLVGAVSSQGALIGPYTSRYLERSLVALRLDDPHDRPRGHDFYVGHEPWWPDVLEDLDATPTWVNDLAGDIGSPDDFANQQRLFLVHGPAFSGKSTALLRLAKLLAQRGWDPYILTGYERLNPAEVLTFFADRPHGMLLVDGLAGDIAEVSELLALAKNASGRMLVVGVERDMYLEHLRRSAPAKLTVGLETTVFVQPTAGLWAGIVDKRDRHARLGVLEGKCKRDTDLHFVRSSRALFTALASLEDAQGFIDRGVGAYAATPESMRNVFAVVALLSRYRLPAPLSAVAAAADVSVREIVRHCEPGGLLTDWIRPSKREVGAIELRHRYLGELITSSRCESDHVIGLSDLSYEVCVACSSRVSIEAIRRKTLDYRIVRELMDLETVRRLLRTDRVDDWYRRLEPHYRWNARYWEQRALGLTDELARASSYARRAVDKSQDPFTLNTLGTVLMRRATGSDEGLDLLTRLSYWAEGLDALASSTDLAHGEFEHPFMTFFGYSQRLLPELPTMGVDWARRLEGAFRHWYDDARKRGHLQRAHVLRAANAFPEDWRQG